MAGQLVYRQVPELSSLLNPPDFTGALKKLVDQGVPDVKGEQQYKLMYEGITELTVLLFQIHHAE